MDTKSYEDLLLTCVDCGVAFPFSAQEQKFFESKGYPLPKRCSVCRKARRQEQGLPKFKHKGERSTAEVLAQDEGKFFKANCSKCGVEFSVPFRPLPNRPIFCKNCHKKLNA